MFWGGNWRRGKIVLSWWAPNVQERRLGVGENWGGLRFRKVRWGAYFE